MDGELSIESGRQRITWKIPDISQLIWHNLVSRDFVFDCKRYFLRLYTTERCQLIESENIFVCVHRRSRWHGPETVSWEVGLKTSTGKDIHMRLVSPDDRQPRNLGTFIIEGSELRENIESYVHDDTLTFFCCMSIGELSYSAQEQEGLAKLQWDYRQLLEEKADTDTCLVVSGKEFRAHRCVLRARSTVFNAMFRQESAEKEKGQVVINDLAPDSFVHFLEYLYTGDVQACLSDENVYDMYKAADKYDVPTLKSECVSRMLRTLSVESFCEVLTLTLWHTEEGLQKKVIKFFKDNMRHIIVTPKWQQFIVSNVMAANELLIQALVSLDDLRTGESA